jgi:hypothetical protein
MRKYSEIATGMLDKQLKTKLLSKYSSRDGKTDFQNVIDK